MTSSPTEQSVASISPTESAKEAGHNLGRFLAADIGVK